MKQHKSNPIVKGDEVIDFIARRALVRSEVPTTFVWTQSAAEQIEAFLHDRMATRTGLVVSLLNRLFQYKVIVNCDRQPYLQRWYLFRSTRIGLFVHRFIRSDEDRALHDHPWNFLVIPIWRGYIEHNQRGQRRVWPIIGMRYRTAEYQHRVELVNEKAAWSIFIRFPYRRTWGFWPREGFQAWNKWWQDKCE